MTETYEQARERLSPQGYFLDTFFDAAHDRFLMQLFHPGTSQCVFMDGMPETLSPRILAPAEAALRKAVADKLKPEAFHAT